MPTTSVIPLKGMAAENIDSDQYVDGSIDAVHLSANSVDSDAYVDGSIDAIHLSANSVDSDAYVDASIDNAHLADDAVGVAELSATGTASSSTFLRGDNAWVTAGGVTVFVGSFTRAQAGASGDVAYTGVGFQPKAVSFAASCVPDQASWGFDDGVEDPGTIYTRAASINFEADESPSSIFPREGTAWTMANIDSLDSDGFTLSWTTYGSPASATIYVKYLAIG